MLVLELILLSIVFYIGSSLIYFTLKLGISPVPTYLAVKERFFAMVEEQHSKEAFQSVVDLGSGWGTLAIGLARRFPDTTVFAYEHSSIPYWFTRLRLFLRPQANLVLSKKNFFHVPLDDFDLVVCYLYPGAMRKLKQKFDQELKQKAIVITHTFSVPGWEPKEVWQVRDFHKTNIYLYSNQNTNQKINT